MLRRAQQIGQVELVAALLPYRMIDPALIRGRHVIHWVDNSSAVAALVNGYSSAVDSAQIVYSIHATLAGLAADVWFEYVRTDANVADEPSRVDLSGERYGLGASPAAGIAAFAESEPIGPARPPELQEWDRPPAEWMVVGDDTPRHGGM